MPDTLTLRRLAGATPLPWRVVITADYVRQTTRYDSLELPGCRWRTKREALPWLRALQALTCILWHLPADGWPARDREAVARVLAPLVEAEAEALAAIHARQVAGRARGEA